MSPLTLLEKVLQQDQPLDPSRADWPALIQKAKAERLLFPLYRELKKNGQWDQLPAPHAQSIREEFHRIVAQGLQLSVDLVFLLDLFQAEKIPVIPLRGPALSQLLYQEPTVRPMADLDLLIPKDALHQALELVKRHGYKTEEARLPFSSNYDSEAKAVPPPTRHALLEFHWSILYPPFLNSINMETVWQRTTQTALLGKEVLSLSLEDLLMHLCWHTVHRKPDVPLLWLYELGLLLQTDQGKLDWNQLISLAQESGSGPLIHKTFQETAQLCGLSLPIERIEALRQAAPRSLSHRFAYRLFSHSSNEGRQTIGWLFTLKGITERLRFLKTILFPVPNYLKGRYQTTNRWQLLLAYGKRWRDLAFYALGMGGKVS